MSSADVVARRTSKVAYVVDRLREEIRAGRAPAGSPLRQIEIAARYGVSPTPVREALRLLAAEGWVAHQDHRGVTVAEMSDADVHGLYRLRSVVERLAVETAVERMTPARFAAIEDAHGRLVATGGRGDAEMLSGLNRDFHFAIYLTGSPVVTRHVEQIWTALPARLTIWGDRQRAQVLLAEHEELMDALRARDAETAGARMQHHVMTSCAFRRPGAPRDDEPVTGETR